MHPKPVTVAIAIALLLLAPTALSAWRFAGTWEPDTAHDAESGYHWPEADGTPDASVRKAYFNAYGMQREGVVYGATGAQRTAPGVHANPLPLGSRLAPGAIVDFAALFGVWKDCNGDGYVGMALSAVSEYRSEALLDPTTCPQGTEHNRDGWVWEYLPFYPHRPPYNYAPARGAPDADPRVWGDFGLPGAEPHFECRLLPAPKGSLRSTGGIVGLADCQTGFLVGGALANADGTAGTDLAFDDPHHPDHDCDHPANRDLVWENPHSCTPERTNAWEENSGNAAFRAWDCDEPRGTLFLSVPLSPPSVPPDPSSQQPAAVGPKYLNVSVATPAPAVLDPTGGSHYDGANNSWNGVRDCNDRALAATQLDNYRSYGAEARDHVAGPEDPKRATDFPFQWMAISYSPVGTGILRDVPDLASMSYAAGVQALHDYRSAGWRSTASYRVPSYWGPTIRGDLQPSGPLHFTFYASLSGEATAAYALPKPTGATYGAEACGDARSGEIARWDCDPAHWWRVDLGAPAEPTLGGFGGRGARIGQTYHLRDVDCYDNSIGDGAFAPTSTLAGATCA